MYMVILSSSARTTNYVPVSRVYNKILLIYFFHVSTINANI